MRTRMVGIFICYAAGIAAACSMGLFSSLVLILVALGIIGVAGIFYFKGILFRMILVLCALLGAMAYDSAVSTGDVPVDEYVTIVGRVSELPYSYDNEMYYYVIAPHTLMYGGESREFDKRVRLCSDKLYEYGDCIRAEGFLERFDKKLNDTGFDSELYNSSRSVHFKMTDMFSEYSEKYYVVSARDIMLGIQDKCAKYIDSRYQGKAGAYLRAVIIGDMRSFDDDVSDMLVYSGARRFLYASFIHISIIVFILGIIFAIIKPERYIRDDILVAVLLIYCACMSARPVFMKALVSMVFVILYRNKFGYVHKADAVSVAGVAVLISNPLLLFDAGFVTAMVCSALNMAFSKPLADNMKFLKRWRYTAAAWIVGTVGVMPVYACFFGGVSLMSVFVQMVTVPLTIATIVLFHIGRSIDLLFGITAFSDSLLSPVLFTYDFIARFFSGLPFSYVFIASPTPYQICLFYSVLVTVYSLITQKKYRYKTLFPITVTVCMMIVVTAGYIHDIGKLKIMFVNVGQGDGAVVSVSYRDKLLIDGGGSQAYSQYNIGRYVYVPFLRSRGISKANAIVTHYHKDHCEGIVEAVKSIQIDTLFMPDTDPDNEWRILLEQAAAERGTRIEFMQSGDKILYKSGLEVEFVSPDSADLKSTDPNDTSLVAYIKYGEFTVLFTGDATKRNEEKIIKRGLAADCDVLKAGHHGSDTSSSADFINAVTPENVIISVGEDNTYALPDDEVMERLSGINIYRTDRDGNITVTAEKNGRYAIEKFR